MLTCQFPIPLRPEVITELCQRANAALLSGVIGATSEEVLSAYFTMLQGAIMFALERNVDPEMFREPIAKLYQLLPPYKGDVQ